MKLLVILAICSACLDLIGAKSNTESSEEPKGRVSSKYNSISTTPKPDAQYLSLQQQLQQHQQQLQQQQLQQQQLQQQYRQHYPQQSPPPQYQIQSQPQRQLHGHAQQVLVQPAATYQLQLHQSQLQAAYQAQLQAQQQPQLQQVIQKAFIVPQQHNRPATMILIAQPAYAPPNVVYTGIAPQQFYLQGAPQARYQISNGQTQQQIPQQVPAHSIGNYQVLAVPAQYQQNVVTVPAQIPQAAHVPQAVPQAAAQPSPLQLAQIAHVAAQQYQRINPAPIQQQPAASSHPYSATYQSEPRAVQSDVQAAAPIRSIPPIITGFENFTPEQQEKIKAQLSAYFGAPLTPLNTGGSVGTEKETESQGKGGGQYGSNDFVPSEQVKEDARASSSNVFKSHYARVQS